MMSKSDAVSAHTAGPWQTKHDNSLEGRATVIANVDGEIIEGCNHYTYDTVAICADEFGEYLPDAAKNARLIVAACNSYDRHFGNNAVSAAEGDLLGLALEALEKLSNRTLEYIGELDGTFDPELECDVEMRTLALDAKAILSQAREVTR